MRLKIQDLSTHLQKGLAPFYFIVGEEPQQQLEALKKIRIKAHAEGYPACERYDISPQFDWESFKNELGALSLFSEKRFIEARLTGNIGKLGARVIVEIANHLPLQTLLVFSSDKLDAAVAKSAWFTAIERLCMTLWPRSLNRQELLSYITKRAKEEGLHLKEEAIHTLVERTEGNLLATEQALEKLCLYTTSEHITKAISAAAIIDITSVDTQFSLFDLVDAALLGEVFRTKQIFNRLISEGVEPILILWAITREVRTIIPLAEDLHKGLSISEGIRKQNLWKHKIPVYTAFLKRCSISTASAISTLHQLIIQASDLDNLIKGRKSGDVRTALFALCLSLAGVQYV